MVLEFDPAGIFSGLAEITYSLVSAVPDTVNGISISFPLTIDNSAVKIISFGEFSSIYSELNLNDIFGGSSSSVMVNVNVSVFELFAPITVPGVKITVSSFSSVISSIMLISRDADVWPAGITKDSYNLSFCILWFHLSAIYKSPLESKEISLGKFNFFELSPVIPPNTSLAFLSPKLGDHLRILFSPSVVWLVLLPILIKIEPSSLTKNPCAPL